jgi:hypothetical protein
MAEKLQKLRENLWKKITVLGKGNYDQESENFSGFLTVDREKGAKNYKSKSSQIPAEIVDFKQHIMIKYSHDLNLQSPPPQIKCGNRRKLQKLQTAKSPHLFFSLHKA